jgi:hypothetical protein
MSTKLNNTENTNQIVKTEEHTHHQNKRIYMRDDHCDWGSSGINDLTSKDQEAK